MKATAQRIPTKPSFEPVDITLHIETEAELAVFMTQIGCTRPDKDWDSFLKPGTVKNCFRNVERTEFLNAKRPYFAVSEALREQGYIK